MGLVEKNTAPTWVDLGDYDEVYLNGIGEDVEFLPNNMVRLKGYTLADHGRQQKVVESCLWSVYDLLRAAALVERKLAEHGFVGPRIVRTN